MDQTVQPTETEQNATMFGRLKLEKQHLRDSELKKECILQGRKMIEVTSE